MHGDSNQREVLEQAGVAGACSLILSASGSGGFSEAVRTAREINPRIHVVARAEFLKEAEVLRQAGAAAVFSGEGGVKWRRRWRPAFWSTLGRRRTSWTRRVSRSG